MECITGRITDMDDHNRILYFSNPPTIHREPLPKNYLANKYIVYNVKRRNDFSGQWYLDKKNGQLWYSLSGRKAG